MKRTILSISLVTFTLLSLFTACNNDGDDPTTPVKDSSVKLVFELYNDANPMAWNDVVSVDNVNEYRMEFFKFYLSNITGLKSDGSWISFKDVVLADASKAEGMTFILDAPSGAYDQLFLGLGLDPVLNAKDPISFAPEEPLSSAQAMYWSWATKYRFIRIDARANQLGSIGDTNDILVAYHPGADEFFKIVKLEKPFNLVAGSTTEYRIKVDVSLFFDGPGGVIDIPTEPQSHTTPDDYDLALKFTKNFAGAISPL